MFTTNYFLSLRNVLSHRLHPADVICNNVQPAQPGQVVNCMYYQKGIFRVEPLALPTERPPHENSSYTCVLSLFRSAFAPFHSFTVLVSTRGFISVPVSNQGPVLVLQRFVSFPGLKNETYTCVLSLFRSAFAPFHSFTVLVSTRGLLVSNQGPGD